MTVPRCVAICGLGLIGGSLARDLHARGTRVLGLDALPEAVERAVVEGVLTAGIGPDLGGLADASLVVLAVPVDQSGELLARIRGSLGPQAVVTDVGSTKRSILQVASALGLAERFVGSHPLAGDARAGWSAAREGLFSDAPVFLCPTEATEPEALAQVRELWLALGASPRVVEAEAHDRWMAWASQLPQLTSSALALALASAGVGPTDLGPGGKDMTRLAGSSPEMWRAICLDRPELVEPALAALEARLAELRLAVSTRDGPAIQRFLATARDWLA